jgi:hypothetical protein
VHQFPTDKAVEPYPFEGFFALPRVELVYVKEIAAFVVSDFAD